MRAFSSFFPFSLLVSFALLSRSLSPARSLLLPSVLCLFKLFSIRSWPVPRLSADAGRLSLGNLYCLFFYNINIPDLPIILNYYFRPSRWALSNEAFFWGLSGVISLQSPSSCSPALPFSLFHLVRFRTSSGSAAFVVVEFVRRVSFLGHRMTFVSF